MRREFVQARGGCRAKFRRRPWVTRRRFAQSGLQGRARRSGRFGSLIGVSFDIARSEKNHR